MSLLRVVKLQQTIMSLQVAYPSLLLKLLIKAIVYPLFALFWCLWRGNTIYQYVMLFASKNLCCALIMICFSILIVYFAWDNLAQTHLHFQTHAGALTGKYTPENPPTGPRGRIYTPEFLTKVRAL